MAENRINRELETREKTVQKKAWQRPETLPSPTPEPGYTYRWIRTSTQGQVDATNVSSKLREGWEPVKAADHPEITLVTIENETFKDNIIIEPGETNRMNTYYYWKDTFENDDIYDIIIDPVLSKNLRAKVKIMMIVFDNGTKVKYN